MTTQALTTTEHPAAITRFLEAAARYASAARAPATHRAYRAGARCFADWCRGEGVSPLPAAPETVAAFIAHLADTGRKLSTIQLYVTAISQAHKTAEIPTPTGAEAVLTTLKGVRHKNGAAQDRKTPATVDVVRRMVEVLPEGTKGTRDRALLLLGFAGAFRRSELVAFDVADLDFSREGLRVTLRRSKTDQASEGRVIGIPYGSRPDTCPVRAMQAWLADAGIVEGPIFRPVSRHGQILAGRLSGKSVGRVVKSYAAAAGEDADRFGGHSLRAGHATTAAANGVAERDIMRQTGHRSLAMVRRYIREATIWQGNSAASLGL